MKPPFCTICKEKFDPFGEEGGLIYFKMRPSDIEWKKHMDETGKVGHPPYCAWFCPKHYEKAKELENLTIDEAMPKIRAFYKK